MLQSNEINISTKYQTEIKNEVLKTLKESNVNSQEL